MPRSVFSLGSILPRILTVGLYVSVALGRILPSVNWLGVAPREVDSEVLMRNPVCLQCHRTGLRGSIDGDGDVAKRSRDFHGLNLWRWPRGGVF